LNLFDAIGSLRIAGCASSGIAVPPVDGNERVCLSTLLDRECDIASSTHQQSVLLSVCLASMLPGIVLGKLYKSGTPKTCTERYI
jgi:hypothetical protein